MVTLYEKTLKERLIPERAKEWRQYERRAANFFKHADQDPLSVLEGVDLDRLNSAELLLALLIYFEMNKGMPIKLWSLFIAVSYENKDWFDVNGLFNDHPTIRDWVDEFADLSNLLRRRRCLELFNQPIAGQGEGC